MVDSETNIKIRQLRTELLSAQNFVKKFDEKLISIIENQEHDNVNSFELIDLLRQLLKVIDTHQKWEYHPAITQLSQNSFSQSSYIRLYRRIRESFKIAAQLIPFAEFVDSSNKDTSTWGLVSYINEFCRKFYPEARVIIHPNWEYNYTFFSITQNLLEIANTAELIDSSLKNALISNIFKSGSHFITLSYPPTASNNIMQLVLWSHEISHFVDIMEGINAKKSSSENKSSNNCKDVEINSDTFPIEDLENNDLELESTINESLSTQLVQKFISSEGLTIDNVIFEEIIKILNISKEDENFAEVFSNQVIEPLAQMIRHWAREVFADVLSIRLFGPAPIFAFHDFIGPIASNLDSISDMTYPTLRIRLMIMLKEYQRWNRKTKWVDKLDKVRKESFQKDIEYFQSLIDAEVGDVTFLGNIQNDNQRFYHLFYKVLINFVDSFTNVMSPEIDKIVQAKSPNFLTVDDLTDNINLVLQDFDEDLPARIEKIRITKGKFLALVLNAGWIIWSTKQKQNKFSDLNNYDIQLIEFERINKLILKALENSEAFNWFNSRKNFGIPVTDTTSENDDLVSMDITGPILTTKGIATKRILYSLIEKDRLIITPILSLKKQIGSCSFDIRIGNEFILPKPSILSKIDPTDFETVLSSSQYTNKIHIPFGKPFIIHPGQFILANTLEFFKLPSDLMGILIGRSSWGKYGLIIANQNKLSPNYLGCITLQITNLGNIPISIYPCTRIGQIIFIKI